MDDVVTVLPDGRIELASPVALPDVLGMLVVGGGPAGTAAAFRAKELGLSALVIEIDDVLKRIRDYDAEKPIKPDFGAGRQMGFPKAGELIEQLHFFADVKGGDLCRSWKRLYRDHSVPVQVGVELLGLEPDGEERWRALVRNHRTETDGALRARHVVLALGAGMPRRLDVPGDVRAIGTRLAAAERYVGAAACVIGGGVSAVEAVIAISAAKAAAADETAVYWSHRGQQMPRVPQALDAALAEAVDVHRNARLLPASVPREVADTDDGKVLRIQVGREDVPGAPIETRQLEFEVGRVVACIGQEIDWGLLNGRNNRTSGNGWAWSYYLLPYIDQAPLFNEFNDEYPLSNDDFPQSVANRALASTPMSNMRCPSDPDMPGAANVGGGGAKGRIRPQATTSYKGSAGSFFNNVTGNSNANQRRFNGMIKSAPFLICCRTARWQSAAPLHTEELLSIRPGLNPFASP